MVCAVKQHRNGLRSETTQKLLAIPNLQLQDALDTTLAMEAAAQNSKALQQSDGENTSVKIFSTVPRRTTKPASATPLKTCHWCGQADHQHSKCSHKEATCHFCHKKGHLSRVCLSKAKQTQGAVGKAKPPSQRAHAVTAAERESSPEELQLFHIGHKQSKTKPLLCTLTIEGKPVEMEIDTGADVSIMSERAYQQLFSHKPLQPSTVRLTTYTQSPIQVKGQLPVQVYYGQQAFDLTLIVSCCWKWPKSARQELAP